VLLAFLPEAEWDAIITREGLQRFTPQTITDRGILKAQLKEIRTRGYAFSDQEVDREVRAVAAPIVNPRGELMAGLTVAGPAYRINKTKVQSLGRLVIRYAEKIAAQLQNPSPARGRRSVERNS
jgi:DNA-binding IclR family transcriptional regulator